MTQKVLRGVKGGSVVSRTENKICLVTTFIYISRLVLTNERVREATVNSNREEAGSYIDASRRGIKSPILRLLTMVL